MKYSKILIDNRKKLLKYCFLNNVCHIPSALSMVDYWFYVHKLITKNDALVIGNPNIPLLYKKGFYTNNIKNISNVYPMPTDNDCKYRSPSLGNSLGIAAGIALTHKYKKIFINIGDSILTCGTELEAALYIGKTYKKMSNIILTINCNNATCISTTKKYENLLFNIFSAFKWKTYIIDGHNIKKLNTLKKIIINNINKPLCIIFKTIKGSGVKIIENNCIDWHYKSLDKQTYDYIIKNEWNI